MTKTQIFTRGKDCKHSVVFNPVTKDISDPDIASSVYINRAVLPENGKSIQFISLTISDKMPVEEAGTQPATK